MNILHFYTPSTLIHLANICKALESLQVLHSASLKTMAFYKMCSFAGMVGVRRNERHEISQTTNGNMNLLTRISIADTLLAQISVRNLQMTYYIHDDRSLNKCFNTHRKNNRATF